MTSALKLYRGGGISDGSVFAPNYLDAERDAAYVTLAGTAELVAVPADAKMCCLLSITGDFWYNTSAIGAAAVAADIIDGTASVPVKDGIPHFFNCEDQAGGNISVDAETDATAIIAFFWS